MPYANYGWISGFLIDQIKNRKWINEMQYLVIGYTADIGEEVEKVENFYI